MSKQTFQVDLELQTTHHFEIEANTPDEAVSVAESLLDEGEVGEIDSDYFVISSDAYPGSEKEIQ